MVRRIQVSRKKFNQVEPGDEVFGKWLQVTVSVGLGQEVEYRPSPKDDPNTEYRCFTGCSVSYYRSASKAVQDIPAATEESVTVILYS
jgi:hypothetical protein